MGIIFWGWTTADDVSKPSSCLPRNLVTRWSRGFRHFLSLIFGCRCVFCLRFRSLLSLSKFWYYTLTVSMKLGILGRSKFHVWDHVLCRLTRKYYGSVWQNTRFLANLMRSPILFQIYMGSFGFGFKLTIFVFWKSMQILFTDRVLPIIRHSDQILGGTRITMALSRAKITAAYAFISSRFRPSLIGLARLKWHGVCG